MSKKLDGLKGFYHPVKEKNSEHMERRSVALKTTIINSITELKLIIHLALISVFETVPGNGWLRENVGEKTKNDSGMAFNIFVSSN